jgi:flagellar biosynthetic protein FlhB
VAEEGDAEDRTEAATPRRLEKAREEGNVPVSREAVALASLAGATLAAAIALPPLGGALLHMLRGLLAGAHALDPFAVLHELELGALLAAGVVAGGALLAGAGATLLQTGFLTRLEALQPDLARLSPMAAIGRLFSTDSLVELGRTLAKLLLIGAALWQAVDLQAMQQALHLPPGGLLAALAWQCLRLVAATLVVSALLAAMDLVWVRFRHAQKLRMSREEMREEMRESDGDPQVKGRQRQIRMQRARRRMLAAVPKAAVVITNPTHYAVALDYAPGQQAAPKIVAKGMDSLALRIREIAEQHGVPIVENPPLARALHRLEPDTEVPPEHWQAVAEVISYVFRLKGRFSEARQDG